MSAQEQVVDVSSTEPQGSLWQSEFLITPRKAKLMRRSWAEVFRNEALVLIERSGRLRVEDAHPAIISKREFRRVKKLLGSRAPRKVNPAEPPARTCSADCSGARPAARP